MQAELHKEVISEVEEPLFFDDDEVRPIAHSPKKEEQEKDQKEEVRAALKTYSTKVSKLLILKKKINET